MAAVTAGAGRPAGAMPRTVGRRVVESAKEPNALVICQEGGSGSSGSGGTRTSLRLGLI